MNDDFDPYAIHPMCGHMDKRQQSYVLRDGTEVPAYFLYTGESEPDKPDFIQFLGDVYQEISWEGFDEEGHQVADLAIIRFLMRAEHPHFGDLYITHDNSRPGGLATLRSVDPGKKFPVIHTTRLHVIATASKLPGVILQNQGSPLEFISDLLDQWPPEDTVYRLRVGVSFEPRSNPGVVVMRTNAGAALVGHL